MSNCKHCGSDNALLERLLSIIELSVSPGSGGQLVTRCDLEKMEARIMNRLETIEAALEAVGVKTEEVVADVEKVSVSVDKIAADVTWLKSEIDRLNNMPGVFTPEEQASVDRMTARLAGMLSTSETLKAQTAAVAEKAEALDAATEPPTP